MNIKFLGYNQEALVKYHVSLQEAFVLNYLKQFFQSGNAETREYGGKYYFKIYYSKIMNDNMALDIKLNRLQKLIRSLCERGFIEKYKADINSSTMYMRINDRVLTYTTKYEVIKTHDDILSAFINSNWRLKKNANSNVTLFEENGISYMLYSNTFLATKLIDLYMDLFQSALIPNLKLCLSTNAFDSIDLDNIQVINNKLELSTKNNVTFTSLFKENYTKIEKAICVTFVELFKTVK